MQLEYVLPLLLWAAKASGYAVPEQPVNVVSVSYEWMQKRACVRENCRPPFGLYDDKDVIYIGDWVTEKARDHLLVHELVHFLQHHSHTELNSCIAVYHRELEAYRVQNLYIREVQNDFIHMAPPQLTCAPSQDEDTPPALAGQ